MGTSKLDGPSNRMLCALIWDYDLFTFYLHKQNISESKEFTKNWKLQHSKESIQNQNNNSNRKSLLIKPNQTKKGLNSITNKIHNEKSKNEFVIPELPEGRLLEIKIYTNWGDKYLVGLNGVELFDSNGSPIAIEKVRVYTYTTMAGVRHNRYKN